MAGKNQHVVKRDDGWAVRGAGNQRDTSHHRTQSEAERAADPVAMMGAKPSVMKRPAIVAGDQRLLGWTANVKRALGLPA